MPKRGRPSLGAKAKNKGYFMRVTAAELASWRKLAKRSGVPLSTYIREAVAAYATTSAPAPAAKISAAESFQPSEESLVPVGCEFDEP